MMQKIIDNSAAPVSIFGLLQSFMPQSPEEFLVFLQSGLAIVSIIAITGQIIYHAYKFFKWLRR